MTFQQVKEDIYNYSIHETIRNELLEKAKVNTRMAQKYSDLPRSKGGTSDSVSSEVFRRLMLEMRIKKLDEKMVYIDQSMPLLNDFEREVINYSKNGYKMTQIAVKLNCSRQMVKYERNKAIIKILQYACKQEQAHA